MAGKSDSVSIRVPYKNLKEAEVEMVGVDEARHSIDLNSPSPSSSSGREANGSANISPVVPHSSLINLILSCMVAAGVQFGWALQLSLLTPYIQTLGIGHAFSSFIWLCGPITGLVVQPCVGIWSDKCTSKYGRRRPFILAGSLMISVAVILIGFSADIGFLLGDTSEDCRKFKGTRTRAAFVFIIGFWMLDLANNTVQGPARALLADMAGPDQRNTANAVFCSWMAVGNILGFSSGASGKWHTWFPFLTNKACCDACGNLKAAFLVAVVFLTLCTFVTIYFADEVPLTLSQRHHSSDSAPLLDSQQQNGLEFSKLKPGLAVINDNVNGGNSDSGHERNNNLKQVNSNTAQDQNEGIMDGPGAVLVNLLTSLRHLPPAMHSVLIVMALTWVIYISYICSFDDKSTCSYPGFHFFLFDTDWMGREVYHGDPKGNTSEVMFYDQGVREGAFGLLLNSVVLGISSFLIEPMCKWMGARLVWALSNFVVFVCMAGTAIVSLISVEESKGIEHVLGASGAIKVASLILFALLGFPLAITYSVPFSVTAELTADSGGGQGLAIGVLNLAIVVPQMIVSLGAGPWDALFGGGNIPAFVLASFAALVAGVIAIRRLPDLSSSSYKSSGFHFG
ncbi:Sucrose transport protein [Quillaja saponaria]|uniref:Sucrose transport protein n=1 Tax=Quillaja saponaria TaxID=32244 RepID=A0AAD7L8W0_QUISA|nr:Sucrose transport protein [Quillaja saponaria]